MTQSNQTSDEAAIRACIEQRIVAVRAKDVDALMASYAPDVVTFDMVRPLMNAGAGAVRKRVEEWFGSFASAIDYQIRDLHLSVSGDVAFGHNFTGVRGTNTGGNKVDMWFRETVGFRKIAGRWTVTHQHSSVPFDMTSGKALLDLNPD